MSESGGDIMTDYTSFRYEKKEALTSFFVGMAGSFILLYLFYRQFLVSLIGGILGGILYLQYRKKILAERRRWQLMVEFKDGMDSMVSALVAGYSMENAVTEAYRDLGLLHETETPMMQEFGHIRNMIALHQPLDELFLDLGRRSGVEDIITFAQIYMTARKSGGNLVKVMKRTAENIGEKMEMQREIQTMVAGKKMESICMTVIPLLILVYLQVCSSEFLNPLYESFLGRLFMTGALIVYGLAVLWSRKIMNIPC